MYFIRCLLRFRSLSIFSSVWVFEYIKSYQFIEKVFSINNSICFFQMPYGIGRKDRNKKCLIPYKVIKCYYLSKTNYKPAEMFNISMLTATNQAFNCVLYRISFNSHAFCLSRIYIQYSHIRLHYRKWFADGFFLILCYKCDVWVNLRFYHLVFFDSSVD